VDDSRWYGVVVCIRIHSTHIRCVKCLTPRANTPPVFPGLWPRIWSHLFRLVTKAMSDRLLEAFLTWLKEAVSRLAQTKPCPWGATHCGYVQSEVCWNLCLTWNVGMILRRRASLFGKVADQQTGKKEPEAPSEGQSTLNSVPAVTRTMTGAAQR
jgi:hypothetical protein